MMKILTKFGLIMSLFLFVPLSVGAVSLPLLGREIEVPNTKTEAKEVANKLAQEMSGTLELFCKNLDSTETDILKNVQREQQTIDAYIAELTREIEDERSARDSQLALERSKADQARGERFFRLNAYADSDDEKKAVETYQEAIEDAVEERRIKVDAAIATFRSGVDALMVKRTAAMRSAQNTFQLSIEKTLGSTETNCEKDALIASLKTTFQKDLAAARTKLASDKQNVLMNQAAIKALSATRTASIAAAVTTFKQEVTAATETLKQSFTK